VRFELLKLIIRPTERNLEYIDYCLLWEEFVVDDRGSETLSRYLFEKLLTTTQSGKCRVSGFIDARLLHRIFVDFFCNPSMY